MDPVLIFKLVELRAIMVPEDGQTHTNGFSKNTPGTAGVPGGRDRTLAIKSRINNRKSALFFVKK